MNGVLISENNFSYFFLKTISLSLHINRKKQKRRRKKLPRKQKPLLKQNQVQVLPNHPAVVVVEVVEVSAPVGALFTQLVSLVVCVSLGTQMLKSCPIWNAVNSARC
jgi:hypothetical protein